MGHAKEVAIVRAPRRAAGRIVGPALALLAVAGCAPSALGEELPQAGVWSLSIDDDIVAGSDRYYSGGFALSWVPGPASTPDWAAGIARSIPWAPDGSEARPVYVLGQSAFTPSDITLADPPLDDRPYAGWLYASIGLSVDSARQSDQLALTVGVVGPASLAERSQKAIHRITGSPQPQGWDTQLHNELGVGLAYQHAWRGLATGTLAGLEFDVMPWAGGALGNVYTYANAGVMARYGARLSSDLGPLRIRPGPPGSAFFVPVGGLAWYLFAALDARAVARNIFLDGNTLRDSRSVDKEPLVGDLQAGLELTWQTVRLSYTHVLRTREYKTQAQSATFGAFSVSVAF